MIVTELSKGTKLYLLVGGRGTRLASVTNGKPKPLVDIQEQSFLDIVLDNLSGFDVTLICSDLNYEYFKTYVGLVMKYSTKVFPQELVDFYGK